MLILKYSEELVKKFVKSLSSLRFVNDYEHKKTPLQKEGIN